MAPASFPLAAVVDAESAARFYAGIESEAVRELQEETAPTRETAAASTASGSTAADAGRARRPERSASGTQEPTSRWSAPRWRTSGTASATEFSTADTSEWPSDGGGSSCSLSSILEQEVDPRYYLSPRAGGQGWTTRLGGARPTAGGGGGTCGGSAPGTRRRRR